LPRVLFHFFFFFFRAVRISLLSTYYSAPAYYVTEAPYTTITYAAPSYYATEVYYTTEAPK